MTDSSRDARFRNPQDPNDPEPSGPAWSLPPSPPRHPLSTTEEVSPPVRRGRRGTAVLSAAALAVGAAWLGSGWIGGEVTTEVGTDFTAISITTSNTPVEVRYDDVAEARIIEHRRRGSDRLEHRVTDDRLVVEYRSGGFVFGPSRERLEVVLPQEMSSETPGLMVRTSNGSVAADGRFGSVELTATTGSVDARGTFETVRAHTTTGSVDILGTARDATAQTTTGSVDVEVEDSRTVSARTTTGSVDINVQGAQPAQVQARASTGSVDIEVPNGAYAVDAKSGTGSADVTVDVDPTSTHRIDAETSTGSIDIF